MENTVKHFINSHRNDIAILSKGLYFTTEIKHKPMICDRTEPLINSVNMLGNIVTVTDSHVTDILFLYFKIIFRLTANFAHISDNSEVSVFSVFSL